MIYHLTEVINELKVYASFFPEQNYFYWYGDDKPKSPVTRVWSYGLNESKYLSNKVVFSYSKDEAYLFDYSAILNVTPTAEMADNLDIAKVVIHDLTKEQLKVSEIKTILANNAKAAIVAQKLEKTIDSLKAISEDF